MKFDLACYFPAEKPCTFGLKINTKARVDELLEAVHKKLAARGHNVLLEDLRLYKTDIVEMPLEDLQQRALQWLHEQPADVPLALIKKLNIIFADELPDDTFHIMVADPSVMELLDTLGDPDARYKQRVRIALEDLISGFSSGPSPSEVVKNAKGVSAFLESRGPPLAKLQQRLNDLKCVNLSRFDAAHAVSFLAAAVNFYDNENSRQDAVKDHIANLVGEAPEWQQCLKWANNIEPDASWWHKDFLIALLEFKNILGVNGDAVLQAIVDYSKIISREKFKSFWGPCNFPAILIGLTGNRVQVSAAVCVGPIYVSNLCTFDLSSGFHAAENVIRVARIFKALSLCQTELKAYYDGVLASRDTSLKLSSLYPNPTFTSGVQPPSLVYRKFMARNGQPTLALPDLRDRTTAMYIATLNDTDQEVVVKFTARYNKETHSLLADAGFAPKLHFCERVVGNLYMVVMDRIEGKSIWQLRQEKIDTPAIVQEQVERAVAVLHGAGIVFGDLRDANIMYAQSDGSAQGSVFLVDFDWAGKAGEGRYPATLNTDNRWEESVSAYGVMQKAHDLWQLDHLKDM